MQVERFTLGSEVLRAVLAVACWLSLSAASVRAEPTAPERETARGLMQEGDRLRSEGDLQGALQRFQSAHAIMHVPTTGLDVARTLAQLGRLVEARGTALEVASSEPGPREPKVFAESREQAVELASQLESRIPSIRTTVLPAGTKYSLAIDGTKLPAEAVDVAYRTDPGPHVVTVEALGVPTQTRQVALVEGIAATLTVELPAQTPGFAAAPAAVSSNQSAPQAALAHNDSDPAGPGRVRGIIGLSVGATALIVGATTGILAMSRFSDLKDACPNDRCDASHEDKLSTANTLANVANVALPLGVIGIGYGLFELLTLPSAPPEHAAAPGVQVSFTGTGLALSGTM